MACQASICCLPLPLLVASIFKALLFAGRDLLEFTGYWLLVTNYLLLVTCYLLLLEFLVFENARKVFFSTPLFPSQALENSGLTAACLVRRTSSQKSTNKSWRTGSDWYVRVDSAVLIPPYQPKRGWGKKAPTIGIECGRDFFSLRFLQSIDPP